MFKEEITQYCKNCFELAQQLDQNKDRLKRKEQECEELKIYIESNEQQVKEVETLVMDNDRLINELDQLKAENEQYKKMLEDEEVILALNEVRTGERHLWFNKAEKYKQTLTEIKDFFKEECLICKENYINIIGEICKECKYQDILRKINEVE